MRKVILYIAQSLDGYIATKTGSVDWLMEGENPDQDMNAYGYLDFYHSIDTTLMGYNTYNQILGFDVPFPYPDKENFVFSRNHKIEDENPVNVIQENMVDFVKTLKNKQGKNIWLVGGAQINTVLLNAGLIDEIILSVKPVILGEGLPVFASGAKLSKFSIKKVFRFNDGMAQLVFEKN